MARKKVARKSKRISRARKTKRSWRILRMKASFKRKLRILGLAFIVFISTIVVFAAVALYNFYRTPLAAASGIAPPLREWKGEGRENLLLILLSDYNDPAASVEALSVVSLSPWEKSVTVLSLPVEVEVLIPQGHRRRRLSTTYALGGLARPKQNISLLTNTIRNLLSIPIDGYLLLDRKGLSELEEIRGKPVTAEGVRNLLSPLNFSRWPKLASFLRKSLRTNLSLGEILKIGRFLISVRFDKVEQLSLSKEDLSDEQGLYRLSKNFFLEQKIREENLKVLVLNGTEVPLLARKASFFIENLGAEVLDVKNATRQDYKKSLMVVKDNSSYTVRRLAGIFSIEDFRSLESLKEAPAFDFFSRADLVLILGLDKTLDL